MAENYKCVCISVCVGRRGGLLDNCYRDCNYNHNKPGIRDAPPVI